jgi:hypothetical protein
MGLYPALVTEAMDRFVKGFLLTLLAVVVVIVLIVVLVSMSSDSGASPFVYDGF